MSTKIKMSRKMERKLIASKQPWEPATVARKFKVPVATVRSVMLKLGKNGKLCRSRAKVEAELTAMMAVK